MNKKKQIPGLNARILWMIDPRTRIRTDNRKNIKKLRQNGKKIEKQSSTPALLEQ
jgi:hypothetical protein